MEATTKAITQMTGISNKSPGNLIEQLISIESLLNLLRSLMHVPERGIYVDKVGELDSRIVNLASRIAEISISVCINQHKLLFRDTKALGEPGILYLEKSISICKDLAYQIELIKHDKSLSDWNLTYLFDWNKIVETNKGRLVRYLHKKTEIPIGRIIIKRANPRKISFEIEDEEFPMKGNIKIVSDKAVLELFSGNTILFTDSLVLKKSEDELFVYGTEV